MAEIQDTLTEAEGLIAAAQPNPAETLMRSLLAGLAEEDLLAWQIDLQRTIDRFLPKRRRALTAELERLLGHELEPESEQPESSPDRPRAPGPDSEHLAEMLRWDLADLSERHIFQWATYYRESLASYFDQYLELAQQSGQNAAEALAPLREAIAAHATEIFTKGFRHITDRDRAFATEIDRIAMQKSASGLQSFLDLPIEFCTTRGRVHSRRTLALRQACSSMVLGILSGYAEARFGEQSGGDALPRVPRSWAHTLPFLTAPDLARVVERLASGSIRDGIADAVSPLVAAIDDLSAPSHGYAPLPALAQFLWNDRRLDVALYPPPYSADPRNLEVQCFLDSTRIHQSHLREALHRNVSALVAPLKSDLQQHVAEDAQLRQIVALSGPDSGDRVRDDVISALEVAIYHQSSPRLASEPLRFNFARQFPLHNPHLTRYFHVYRASVRDLMKAFEARNGVRLWCSIRRSGKTTACLDLGETAGRSAVLIQTCAATDQIPDGTCLYDAVSAALGSGAQLGKSFFADAVKSCALGRADSFDRFVLVLDEYERLFGHLHAVAMASPEIRYTVVQPLLDQMVAFTRSNLLVLLGQQPNAHYILMDQNQLSAYVEQDPFPLFGLADGRAGGEFSELIEKVLTDRASFDAGFIQALYEETAGHPFLTVNLLIEFVEWLIYRERPANSLSLSIADYEEFAAERLTRERIATSPEYRFFREAIADATSAHGRERTPWLHAVYVCMRELARSAPAGAMRCTHAEFDQIVARTGLGDAGTDGSILLSTASQANFLAHDEKSVWPKVRLLARIAGATGGRVVA